MTDRTKPRCGSTRRTPANPSRPPDRGGLNALARILLHHRSSGRVGPDDRARARRLRIVRRMGRSGRRAAQGRLQDPGARPNFCVGRRGDRAVPLRGDAGATPRAGAGSRLGNARDESGKVRRREPAAATHRETAVRLLGGARGVAERPAGTGRWSCSRSIARSRVGQTLSPFCRAWTGARDWRQPDSAVAGRPAPPAKYRE
jgi:hypothetical protein